MKFVREVKGMKKTLTRKEKKKKKKEKTVRSPKVHLDSLSGRGAKIR